MDSKLKDFYDEKIKSLGIINVFVIIFFIFSLVFFIVYSIWDFCRGIFSNSEKVNIYYDNSNISLYSINSEDEFYKYKLVTDYSQFYTIEDIVIFNLKAIKNGEYKSVINIFSKDMKKYYNLSEDEYKEKLLQFSSDFIYDNVNNIKLYKLYKIENTNIYMCYIRNDKDIEKKIVLNINTQNNTYTIDDIEF